MLSHSYCSNSLKLCYFSSSTFSTSASELVTEHSITPLAQKRVFDLLLKVKTMPKTSIRRGQEKSLNDVAEWVTRGADYIDLRTFNFLLHICVTYGSADDLDFALAVAQRQNLNMKEPEMNSMLSGLAKCGELAMVKDMLKKMNEDRLKVRLNTLTQLLERGAREKDFPFIAEVLDMMRASNFFPSSASVISDIVCSCVGEESRDAIKVVKSAMSLHNFHSMDVTQETAREFLHWIKRYTRYCFCIVLMYSFSFSLSRETITRSTKVNNR